MVEKNKKDNLQFYFHITYISDNILDKFKSSTSVGTYSFAFPVICNDLQCMDAIYGCSAFEKI